MTFATYDPAIPNPTNDPSVDVFTMQTNSNSISAIISQDHIGFNNTLGGYHKIIHQPPQGSDPGALLGIGQTYTKTVLGDEQLFFESGLGIITQITSSRGIGFNNVPNILSGTFTPTGVATAITPALPQNVYGYILFFRQSGSYGHQIGVFSTNATKAFGMSMRVVTNSSSANDPVELINNPAASDLKLYGIRDDFSSSAYNWRLHYWPQ